MRLYTSAGPLFAAEGWSTLHDEEADKHLAVFLFQKHEDAQKKACELIHTSHCKVSVYRLDEFNVGRG